MTKNNDHLEFVISEVKSGIYDLVSDFRVNREKECIEFDLKNDLVEKFSNKFPGESYDKLDDAVRILIIKSYSHSLEKKVKEGFKND